MGRQASAARRGISGTGLPRRALCLLAVGLARLNSTGNPLTLDAGFGTGGTLTTSLKGDDGAGALLVQPDGKVVAVGFSENNATGQVFIALARYNG